MLIPTPEDYKPKAEILAQTGKLSSTEFSGRKVEWGKAGHFSASLTPSLMGLYGSPLKVFEQMRTGQWDDLSNNLAVRFGQLMESWVADKASQVMDIDVFKCPYYLGWRNGTWLTCSKDFHVATHKERWAMECKTTSSFGTKKQLGPHLSNQTSLAYEAQCQHQMLVDELDGVFNAVLVLENRYHVANAVRYLEDGVPPDEIMQDIPHMLKVLIIKRNDDAVAQIKNYLIKCRELFVAGGSPPADPSSHLSVFLKQKERSGLFVEADDKTEGKIQRISSLKKQSRELAEEAKYLENELLQALDDATGYTWEGDKRFEVKQIQSNRFDSTKFKADHPTMAEEYMKQSTSNQVKIYDRANIEN